MASHQELKTRTAQIYNAAADYYDAPENSFWLRFGRRTVEQLELEPGMRVLDVCCGSGASAMPAAQAVGATGRVVAVDVADDLLALLRKKAHEHNLLQLEVRTGDILDLDLVGPRFDAVVCVFGIFFVGEMEEAVRQLWRRVVSGGQLAITTWGPRLFEPVNSRFWEAVRTERADLYKAFRPWDVITTADALRKLLLAAGTTEPQIVEEAGSHPLPSPGAVWALLRGSGYRGTLDQLTPAQRKRVRQTTLRYIADAGVTAVETNVLYATAKKRAI